MPPIDRTDLELLRQTALRAMESEMALANAGVSPRQARAVLSALDAALRQNPTSFTDDADAVAQGYRILKTSPHPDDPAAVARAMDAFHPFARESTWVLEATMEGPFEFLGQLGTVELFIGDPPSEIQRQIAAFDAFQQGRALTRLFHEEPIPMAARLSNFHYRFVMGMDPPSHSLKPDIASTYPKLAASLTSFCGLWCGLEAMLNGGLPLPPQDNSLVGLLQATADGRLSKEQRSLLARFVYAAFDAGNIFINTDTYKLSQPDFLSSVLFSPERIEAELPILEGAARFLARDFTFSRLEGAGEDALRAGLSELIRGDDHEQLLRLAREGFALLNAEFDTANITSPENIIAKWNLARHLAHIAMLDAGIGAIAGITGKDPMSILIQIIDGTLPESHQLLLGQFLEVEKLISHRMFSGTAKMDPSAGAMGNFSDAQTGSAPLLLQYLRTQAKERMAATTESRIVGRIESSPAPAGAGVTELSEADLLKRALDALSAGRNPGDIEELRELLERASRQPNRNFPLIIARLEPEQLARFDQFLREQGFSQRLGSLSELVVEKGILPLKRGGAGESDRPQGPRPSWRRRGRK
jgi:hypothetical protein